ncbi:MAG: outer membrane lipoprotein-sorting protein [bacterium]|jgi:hypothetical protein|nr:DUF1329 domain-containing protein [Gammaproteobacteria bacterium]HIL84784.1 DUF1329 domain-containing protein [Pseudomonadales bacterium]
MKSLKKFNSIWLFALFCSSSGFADTNKALEAWKEFAKQTGNPNHAAWVEEISKPAAVALAKEWREVRGYDSYDLLANAELPEELKPGLKINSENMDQFPWLKDFLPEELLGHLTSDWSHIKEITIVPTNTYYMHKGYLQGTKELKEKNIELQINEAGELLYPDGSYALMSGPGATSVPFMNPKNGLELNWSYVAHSVNTDTLDFEPIHMRACTPAGKVDSEYKADLWWWHYHNRQNVEPFGDIAGKEDYIEGGSIFFLEPYDIRGLAGVRQRYADAKKDDDFKVFIPSLRRTRVLTGSDAQDPIASGQELTWDDWRAYWGKTDVESFEYKLVGEGYVLASPEVGYVYDSAVLTEDACNYESMELELRPVWILDIIDKTGKYMYSKRRTWVDKEFYYMQYHMTWDPRGNPYRNWEDSRAWRPSEGDAQWRYVMVNNYVTKRMTTLYMTPNWERRDLIVTEEMFDVDQLRDYR